MKKFTNNDLFYNTLLANPKYTIVLCSGSLRINDQINQNNENSSSISGVDYPRTFTSAKLGYTGSHQYTASISREFIRSIVVGSDVSFDPNVTSYSSLKKIAAMKSIFRQYKIENDYSDINYYLSNNGVPEDKKQNAASPNQLFPNTNPGPFITPTASINLIEIPRGFYGNYIRPGSVYLNMYISGTLMATAADVDKTGKLIQTYGSGSGGVIGSVFYEHGLMLITGTAQLSAGQAPYIQPLSTVVSTASNDYLKWVYFGSYQNTTGSAILTKYELTFEGANAIPTLMMMCHAEKNELNWSNNRTFIEVGQGEDLLVGQTTSSTDITGSTYYANSGAVLIPADSTYRENPVVIIKNTISSSFAHYSASYSPQVFISQVGIYDDQKNLIAIAKLANPVRKTKESDYTFKLKLDL